jgi:LysR family hydrogen peroxide-inducible transcriptional activator
MSDSAPHPFTLRQLQYALAVAEGLSFHKAAARCHVSQPSLSAQIAQMEHALGVRLFERDRRRVLVTHAGQELLERAGRVVLEADDLAEAARRLGDPLSGTLAIGVIPTISPYLLPSLTPRFRAEYRKLRVHWVEDKTQNLVASLTAGTLDAALLALEADIGDVEREVIVEDPFVLATSRDHPLGGRSSAASTGALRDQPVLLLDEGHCFREQALAVCATASARELEFRATSLPTLVQMVAGGAGVTLLPQLAVKTEVPRGRLHVRRFAKPAPYRTIALVWRKRSPLRAALQRIATTVRAAYPRA